MSTQQTDEDIRLAALRTIQTADPNELRNHISQLEQAKDQMEQEYESGDSDMTYAEHRAKMREINQVIGEYRGELAASNVLSKIAHMTEVESWQRKVEALKRATKGRQIDYNRNRDMDLLDRHIKFLANDPRNAGQSADWFLQAAHEMTQARASGGGASDSPRGLDGLKGLALEQALAKLTPAEVEAYLSS